MRQRISGHQIMQVTVAAHSRIGHLVVFEVVAHCHTVVLQQAVMDRMDNGRMILRYITDASPHSDIARQTDPPICRVRQRLIRAT